MNIGLTFYSRLSKTPVIDVADIDNSTAAFETKKTTLTRNELSPLNLP
jgi:hypothetical protein